jgi:hypothetical protein
VTCQPRRDSDTWELIGSSEITFRRQRHFWDVPIAALRRFAKAGGNFLGSALLSANTLRMPEVVIASFYSGKLSSFGLQNKVFS